MLTTRQGLSRVLFLAIAALATPAAAADPAGTAPDPFVVATGPSGAPWVAGSLAHEREPGFADPGDILVVRADAQGRAIQSSAWLGGSGRDVVRAIAVDGAGYVWIAGSTDSPDFPVPVDPSRAGAAGEDAFVVKLSPDGATILAAWRSSEPGTIHALAVAPGGRIVAAGSSLAILDAQARPVASRTLTVAAGDVAFDVTVASDGSIVVAGATPAAGGFVARWSASLEAPAWREDVGAQGLASVARLGRGLDGSILALGDGRRVVRVDGASGISAPAVAKDVTADPVLRLMSGAVSIERLQGLPIDDAAAAADGTVWVVGESASALPEESLAVAQRAPGVEVFVARDPLAPAAVCPGTVNFDNSAGTGLWETAANWDTNVLPGPTDDVCITGFSVTLSSGAQTVRTVSAGASGTLTVNGGSLTISQDATFNALNLVAGTIGGAATITINGSFGWSGGTLGGSGTVTAAGGTALSGGPLLDGRRLINPAGQTMTYASVNAGFNFQNGAVLQNDGTFDSQSDNTLQWTGAGAVGVLENSGTYKKSGGSGFSTFSVTVTNTGTIQAQTGTITWVRDMTSTGAVTASSGATLLFQGGIHTLNPAPTIPAGATLRVDGQTVTFATGYNPLGATLLNAGTLTLNGTPNALASLTQTAGTLTSPVDITVTGAWTWSGGILGQTASGTKATALSGMTLSGGPLLDGRRLINPAGQTMTYASVNAGFNFQNGAVLQNDGTFDSQSDNTLQWTGAGAVGVLENAGTFKKSAGAGGTVFSVNVTNTGTIQAQTGTITWVRDMTSTGTVTASSGATLLFQGGIHTLNPAPTIPAGATLRVDGQTVTFATGYNPLGATLLNAGTLTLNGTPNVLASLTHNAGTLTSPVDITVTGAWAWSGGTLTQSSAGTKATALSGMTLSGGPLLDGRRLINPAGQTMTYASVNAGFNFQNGAVLQNDGTFDSQSDNTLQWTGAGAVGVLENAGTFKKSAGAGGTVFSVNVTNTGTIQAQTGTITWARDMTSTGSVTASSGARLLFQGGNHILNPAPAIPAGATLRVDGQTVTFNGGYNPLGATELNAGTLALNGSPNVLANLAYINGTLTGSGDFTVTGAWTWAGGTLTQSVAGTQATIGGTLAQSNSVVLDGKKLVNPSGKTLTFTSTGTLFFSNGAVLENSGTADFQADASLSWTGAGAVGVLSNLGLVKKSAGSAISSIDISVQNQGTIDLAAATLRFTRGFTQTAGSVRLIGGALQTTSTFDLQGGSMVGSGTLEGTVTNSGGSMSPGLSPGSFTIPGSYVQSGTGAYAVELGGLTPVTQHDRIDVTTTPGSATLGGVLNVSLINGFTPVLGNSFTIMTYVSHTGTFATINAPDLGPTLTWNVAYNATSVVLTVAPVANPDLALAKSDAPDPVPAGQDLTYTLTVTNTGTATATSTTLSDPLPANVAFKSVSTTVGTCNQAAGTVSCNLGDLAQGASATVTIVVTPAAAAVPSITNTATVATTATDPIPANNTASATTTVVPAANLSISLTDSPDPVASSGTLTYTVGVTNAGPSGATSLTMTNTLPAGTTFQSAAGTGWTCGQAAGVVTCTRPSLAPGAAPDITITVTAPANGGSITDTASVTAAEFDPTTPNTASATTGVTATADLSITKGDAPDPVNAGATLTYTLNVSNAGPSLANAVTVIDTLPAGAAFASASGTGWTCNQAAGTVTCTRATLAVGAAPAITITVLAPAAGGSITNTASVTATENDPTTPNTASATTTVTPIADLSLTNSDSPDPVGVGATLTYTIAVSNAGPSGATGITVTDVLPAGVTFQSAVGTGWTCSQAAGTVTCTRATLAVAAAPAITITVTAPANGGSISNAASVLASEADPNAANNAATATTSVTASADLSIANTDAPDPVSAGAALAYTVTVTNAGPSTAAAVTVTDTLPAGSTFVSAAGTGWTCNQAAGTVTCARASLAVGAAPAITINVTAPANGGSITNTASVAAATADPNAANNSAAATTTVTAVADVSIAKSASASSVGASTAFSYTLAVSNAGPSTAGTVAVTDPLPSGVVFVSAAGTGWTCNQAAGTVTCTRATLAVGAAPAITIDVTAPAAAATLVNTASVATAGDPSAANNTSTANVDVTASADLRVTKTASPSTVPAGGTVTFTIAVQNLGPSTATGVEVIDQPDPSFGFVSASGIGWTCVEGEGDVVCDRATLASGATATITLVFTVSSVPGSYDNNADVSSATQDPALGNNNSEAVVTVIAAGTCNSLQDLLDQVTDGGIAPNRSIQLAKFLQTTIGMSNAGQRAEVLQRLSVFVKQVQAARAQGAVDAETAADLVSCAEALRQQLLVPGTKKKASRL